MTHTAITFTELLSDLDSSGSARQLAETKVKKDCYSRSSRVHGASASKRVILNLLFVRGKAAATPARSGIAPPDPSQKWILETDECIIKIKQATLGGELNPIWAFASCWLCASCLSLPLSSLYPSPCLSSLWYICAWWLTLNAWDSDGKRHFWTQNCWQFYPHRFEFYRPPSPRRHWSICVGTEDISIQLIGERRREGRS